SLRAASARRADALGEVMRELNDLSQALQTDRQEATETNALLLAVISNIDLAVFTFDEENRTAVLQRSFPGSSERVGKSVVPLFGNKDALISYWCYPT
ncbi:MAG TPA: hypothetical protein VHS80_05225, partial [Chthoniobacterales bacterium]|nr:hypothetical protein [Chthoniobacterales bacterium]